jgi:hypothetical protein
MLLTGPGRTGVCEGGICGMRYRRMFVPWREVVGLGCECGGGRSFHMMGAGELVGALAS